jgi:FdhD protein
MPLRRSMNPANVTEWADGDVRTHEDYLAAEEPLEIRVGGRSLSVTMRTPGDDEELAVGFLLTEGIIQRREQIAAIERADKTKGPACNTINIELRDCDFELGQLQRNFFAASSCGICGKATIASIRNRGLRALNASVSIDPRILCEFAERLRENQQVFEQTGGLHAAALFHVVGELLVVREDIGRHNAVDKVVGWGLLNDKIPLSTCALMVSGRGGFEIVQKALAAGIPIVASVSAPSSLAVEMAREFNLTLIGFLRERRFVVYSGEGRCLSVVPDARMPVVG